MNKTQNSKDIKKNQGDAKDSGEFTTKIVLGAPYGQLHIGPKLDLEDHAGMRANQLSAMLLLIHGKGHEYFSNMNENSRQSYLWLAFQLSAEIEEILPFMTVRVGAAA